MLNRFRLRPMAAWLVLGLWLAACSRVPITGRSQLNFVSSQELNTLAAQQYQQLLAQSQVVTSTAQAAQVERVGRRVAQAVTEYLTSQGQGQLVQGYNWEFALIADDQPNAFCMPGGKIGIYTGILPYTQTDDGLAVVMGHEVAHAIAQHSNERMSQQLATQVGTGILSERVGQQTISGQVLMAAVGLGAQVGILLPYSRTQESEADRLGLIFMARAGYDPSAAVPFWTRMAAAGDGAPPEFLSTHPAPETRIRNLRKWIPEARQAAAAR